MPDFKGERICSVDEKGRLVIPAKLREELGAGAVITRWWECAVLFPAAQWEAFTSSLNAFSALDEDADELKRHFISGAVDCAPDKMGRITLPPHLIRAFGLDKDVVVAGMIDRLEIWNKEAWERKRDPNNNLALRAMARRLLGREERA